MTEVSFKHCGPTQLGPYALSFELVTPEMAKGLLGNFNKKNRKLHKKTVERFTDDTHKGRWAVTPVPIIICSDNELGDGQHRLEKVIASNEPCWFLIARGADPAIRNILDSGKTRTTSDLFTINGKRSDAATVALYFRQYMADPKGNWASKEPLNKLDHLEFYEDNSKLIDDSLELAKRTARGFKAFSINQIAFFICLALHHDVDEATLHGFLEALCAPPTKVVDDRDPVWQMRVFCNDNRGMDHHKNARDRMGRVYWLLVTTFNRHINGQLSKLPVPKQRAKAEDFYPSPEFGVVK